MSFSFTVGTSFTGNLNKNIDKDGKKTSNALLSYGSYRVEEADSLRDLILMFKNLLPNQALIPGIPKNGNLNGVIGSRDMGMQGAISRTKGDFVFNGSHILLFDYDPDINGFTIGSAGHYIEVLRDIDPSLVECEIGVTYGSSYGVMKEGVLLSDKLSLHAYIRITNSTNEKVEEYKAWLENEAWKKGYGHVKISKSGSLLQRACIDFAVFGPQTLFFEAKPTLADGITQIEAENHFTAETGSRDLSAIPKNDGKGKLLFEQAKELKKAEAQIIKDKYIDEKSDELVTSQGISKDVARETIRKKVEDGVLTADDILHSKDKGTVKVKEVLLDPEQYKNLHVLDPINPKDNEYVAMVYVNEHNIVCHSFKSGGVNYKLVANESVLETLCETAENKGDTENKKFASKIVALCDGAGIEDVKRKDFALTLKSKKIVSGVNNLKTKALKIPFPDIRYVGDEVRLLNTIGNLEMFLRQMNIDVKYDEILKEGIIRAEDSFEGFNKDTDDKVNSQFTKLRSECIKVGLPEKIVADNLPAIIDDNSFNPLMEMVTARPWDGIDRLGETITCLESEDDKFYIKEVMTRWLLQCVAAWDYIEHCPIDEALPRFESVLVFVGAQGLSKTKFYEGLLPKKFRKYVAAGIHLDTHSKDSVKLAICSGICELGELDSTFTKDIGALKAFMSLPVDKFRLPYARNESSFKRRTSFCASVNDTNFLVDPTGNRRFLPIWLRSIDYVKYMKIDKQQLFAQVYDMYLGGEKWWIDASVNVELYAMLNKKHDTHMILTPVDDIIEKVIRDTLGSANNASYSDPLKVIVTPPLHGHDLVWKTATEIATHFRLPPNKRGTMSNIKKELLKAGIENKGNAFKVRLAS